LKSNENDESSQNVNFKCDVCDKEHSISSNCFESNQIVSALIDNNIHLSEEQKELKENIKKIEDIKR
jgi:CRISPR/Cas system CSM-associated protein Csm4 (group 5 of RAMP superfamily)